MRSLVYPRSPRIKSPHDRGPGTILLTPLREYVKRRKRRKKPGGEEEAAAAGRGGFIFYDS